KNNWEYAEIKKSESSKPYEPTEKEKIQMQIWELESQISNELLRKAVLGDKEAIEFIREIDNRIANVQSKLNELDK
ncbi:MAG: hypothetical protein FWF00_03325, partial [Endomicrobia bacterium]|nr:hypothetical protein [Endomicrobiia bacterium]